MLSLRRAGSLCLPVELMVSSLIALSVILSEETIRKLRQQLRKAKDVLVTPEEIVGAVRRILNEAALGEMEKVKISLPEKKPRPRKPVEGESK